MNRRPKVLLAVTVYNGWAFVPRCLKSAKNIRSQHANIDVLALDDASPEPGFSEKLASLCAEIGVHYYRTPRNLGIVRNVNLGLLAAVEKGYDYVVICNSDVIFSRQTVDFLLETVVSDPRIGSVTAWSNNVSIYSLPNDDPDANIASQEVVDWIAAVLAGDFQGGAIDIPAGISFCLLIPTAVVRDVGLMDPVFGRGYCEETDWSLRSLSMGYRLVLAPAAFVYHQGRGSTLSAGLVSGAHTTVPENEAVIDYRYPLFRSHVEAFMQGGILERMHRDATRRIVHDAGKQFGFEIRIGKGDLQPRPGNRVQVSWGLDRVGPRIEARFRGFRCAIPSVAQNPYDSVVAFFGAPASSAVGGHAGTFRWQPPAPSARPPRYPDCV